MAKNITRVTVNLNSELVQQVDKYADDMNINRTAAVAVLLSQAVNSQKAMSDIGDLLNIYKGEQAKQTLNNKSLQG
jgi:metal-responsive CopG/Arc/MetJ family transcriptional regulator